jgi:uncharacterized protein YjbI with pentapeptide repeats
MLQLNGYENVKRKDNKMEKISQEAFDRMCRHRHSFTADFSNKDYSNIDFHERCFDNQNFSNSVFDGANLFNTGFYKTLFVNCDFSNADIRRAVFHLCTFENCTFENCKYKDSEFRNCDKVPDFPMACPRKGEFIAYKRCHFGYFSTSPVIVKLFVPEDALRSSATSNKIRVSKAKVLEIRKPDNTKVDFAYSTFDPNFEYRVGKTVEVPDFNTDRYCQCTQGIHCFMTKEEALEYFI